MGLGIASVAWITVIAFVVGLACKRAVGVDNHKIPVVCAIVGIILGILAYKFAFEGFPADNAGLAAAVGAVSGLAATGIHQLGKQLKDDSEE